MIILRRSSIKFKSELPSRHTTTPNPAYPHHHPPQENMRVVATLLFCWLVQFPDEPYLCLQLCSRWQMTSLPSWSTLSSISFFRASLCSKVNIWPLVKKQITTGAKLWKVKHFYNLLISSLGNFINFSWGCAFRSMPFIFTLWFKKKLIMTFYVE